MSQTADRIRSFLEETFLIEFGTEADDTTDLFAAGYIDSYGYIELVSFLEAEHPIKITDDELASDALTSLAKIVQFVDGRLEDG